MSKKSHTKYYIASRMDWDSAEAIMGKAPRLNSRVTKMLKFVTKEHGIQKNKLGKRLYFYSTPKHIQDEASLLEFISEEADMLNVLAHGKGINALAWFETEAFSNALKKTNDEWTDKGEDGRMNKDQYKGYNMEFVAKMYRHINPTKRLDK